MKKKVISLLLISLMVLFILPVTVFAAAGDTDLGGLLELDISKGSITINDSGATGGGITGTVKNDTGYHIIDSEAKTTTNTIAVTSATASTFSITLDNVSIDASGCAFGIGNGTVNLTLTGGNSLKSGSTFAGLQVTEGTAVAISGTGSLTATGGDGGAGIGGSIGGGSSGGDITISSGTIVATGGTFAAGIGGGEGAINPGDGAINSPGLGGAIVINNGDVTAIGGEFAAGIGGGSSHDSIDHLYQGFGCNYVRINGGKVTANGSGYGGAGIGSGANNRTDDGSWTGNDIGITNGIVQTTGGGADMYGGGAGIGGGRECNGGTISITGGTVTAAATFQAAGVGGGSGATNQGGDGGTISISGDATSVTASGAYESGTGIGGAGIGGGLGRKSGNITIDGGFVRATGSAGIGGGFSGLKFGDVNATVTGGTIEGSICGGGGSIVISGGSIKPTGYDAISPEPVNSTDPGASKVYLVPIAGYTPSTVVTSLSIAGYSYGKPRATHSDGFLYLYLPANAYSVGCRLVGDSQERKASAFANIYNDGTWDYKYSGSLNANQGEFNPSSPADLTTYYTVYNSYNTYGDPADPPYSESIRKGGYTLKSGLVAPDYASEDVAGAPTVYYMRSQKVTFKKEYLKTLASGASSLSLIIKEAISGSDTTMGTLDYTVTVTDGSGGGSGGGGSTGGGGGGATTAAQTFNGTILATDGKESVKAGIVSTMTGGILSATVGDENADSMIDWAKNAKQKGKKATIVVEMQPQEGTTATDLTLSHKTVDEIAKSGASFTFKSGIGSVTITSAGMANLAKKNGGDGNVKLSISTVNTSGLSPKVKKIVGDNPVYDFDITANGRKITSLTGGVTLTVPYTATHGEKTVKIYYVDSKGVLRSAIATVGPNGATFKLNSF